MPVFGINPANKTGRVSYGSNDTAGEMSFTLLSPILMGFQDNNANVNTGDTLEYDILGETLTITLDYNESTGVCIMNGTFSDGASYINLTMRSQENTFDYEQYIIVEDDPINPPAQGIGGGAAIVYYNYENVTIDENGYYHTYQEGYNLQPGNTAVIETDIVFGEFDEILLCGTFIYRFKCDNTQPDLSGITDFKTVTKDDFLTYFSDEDTWSGNDHSEDTYIYFNYDDGNLYADPFAGTFLDGFIIDATIPWTLLPQ